MSETFSRQEHTVVNVGGDEEGEGGLRLITCVKASQGFDWNQGMSRSMLCCYPNCSLLWLFWLQRMASWGMCVLVL
jgi:hypothetical protein